MLKSNAVSKLTLAAGITLAGASALPAADWTQSHGGRADVRSDYRDLRHDYAAINHLRERVERVHDPVRGLQHVHPGSLPAARLARLRHRRSGARAREHDGQGDSG